jgi:hypothetical protein
MKAGVLLFDVGATLVNDVADIGQDGREIGGSGNVRVDAWISLSHDPRF